MLSSTLSDNECASHVMHGLQSWYMFAPLALPAEGRARLQTLPRLVPCATSTGLSAQPLASLIV
eukprot:558653-Amphidinium_carterae.1